MQSKVTEESNELTYDKFFNKQRRVSIPLFQRRYVWSKKNLDQLLDDISAIQDSQDSARFLGTVVAVSRPGSFGDYEEVEVVDGQQRLTTVYLFLAAISEVLCGLKAYKDAERIVTRFLIFQERDLEHTTTLFPSLEDRNEFQYIMQILRGIAGLSEELDPFEIRPPSVEGLEPPESRQEMLAQYFRIRRLLNGMVEDLESEQAAIEELKSLTEIVTTRLTFIFLKLRDPASAPLIFESLNEKGVKTTIGDLVRNEIFSKVYDEPARAKSVYSNNWQPFFSRFSGSFDDYLFPYCLCHDHTVAKSDCFQELRKLWKDLDEPDDVIADLSKYAETFLALELRKEGVLNECLDIRDALYRFHDANVPSSVFPFVFSCVKAFQESKCSKEDLLETLKIIESFLIRRAVCGIEPTGLHAVFKTLWSDIGRNVSPTEAAKKLKSITTQVWPEDSDVIHSVKTRPLYRSRVIRFLLHELEVSDGADMAGLDFEIEHVMPQALTSEWKNETGITEEEHERLKDTLGNLVTLSQPLNQKVRQSVFSKKRQEYRLKSKFALARSVADTHNEWTKRTIEVRNEQIGLWINQTWARD
ncbi:DUF262 domain-containing protein [Marinihelvus fidelis]|uniref:DUF262 domain-containing protein n=1 Tax=Marinihelvus fidelis TaxID=2613842 RepID=A0A5N0T6D8_9GAMM|nr:DUF262 domain-containing protein [Marinihelvus fidelis]KAA9130328.1 DUF262 domain-containing protein [Marinihelvus fidelis]